MVRGGVDGRVIGVDASERSGADRARDDQMVVRLGVQRRGPQGIEIDKGHGRILVPHPRRA